MHAIQNLYVALISLAVILLTFRLKYIDEMAHIDEQIICKGDSCKRKVLHISTILRHLNNNLECKEQYSDKDIEDLKAKIKKRKAKIDVKRRKNKRKAEKEKGLNAHISKGSLVLKSTNIQITKFDQFS